MVNIYAEWDDPRVGDSRCSVLDTTAGCGPNVWDPALYFPDAIDVRVMNKMVRRGPPHSPACLPACECAAVARGFVYCRASSCAEN